MSVSSWNRLGLCFLTTTIGSVLSNFPEEGEPSRLYLDALVAAMEALFSMKGNLQAIKFEFEKIHQKIGINIKRAQDIILRSDNALESDIREIQEKIRRDQVPIEQMINPLRELTISSMVSNFHELKQEAEDQENQFIQEIVEVIKEQVDEGVKDLYKFNENIEEMMGKIEKLAVNMGDKTTRRRARVHMKTTRPHRSIEIR